MYIKYWYSICSNAVCSKRMKGGANPSPRKIYPTRNMVGIVFYIMSFQIFKLVLSLVLIILLIKESYRNY